MVNIDNRNWTEHNAYKYINKYKEREREKEKHKHTNTIHTREDAICIRRQEKVFAHGTQNMFNQTDKL